VEEKKENNFFGMFRRLLTARATLTTTTSCEWHFLALATKNKEISCVL
jgi:hypothetical protein